MGVRSERKVAPILPGSVEFCRTLRVLGLQEIFEREYIATS